VEGASGARVYEVGGPLNLDNIDTKSQGRGDVDVLWLETPKSRRHHHQRQKPLYLDDRR